MSSSPRFAKAAVVALLQRHRILGQLSREAHDALAQGVQRAVPEGSVLIAQGDEEAPAYLLLGDGMAASLLPGRPAPWRPIPSGATVGLVEAFLGRPHTMRIFARATTAVLILPPPRLREAFLAAPTVFPALLNGLCDRVGELLGELDVALGGAPRDRIRQLLRLFADVDGNVTLPLAQLAVHAATSRETASRTVSDLVRAGFIERVGPGRLRLLSEADTATVPAKRRTKK